MENKESIQSINNLTSRIYTIPTHDKNITIENIIKRLESLSLYKYSLEAEHLIRVPIGDRFNYTYNTIRLPLKYKVNSYYDIYSKVVSLLNKMGLDIPHIYLKIGLTRYNYSIGFSNNTLIDYQWYVVVYMGQDGRVIGGMLGICIVASTGIISMVKISQSFYEYIDKHREYIINTTAYNMISNAPTLYNFNDVIRYVRFIEYLIDINRSLYGEYRYEPPYYGLKYPINTSSTTGIELYQVYKGYLILSQYVYSYGFPGRLGITFSHRKVLIIYNCLFPIRLYTLRIRNYVISREKARSIAIDYIQKTTRINKEIFKINDTYKIIYWMDNNIISNYWCVSIFFNIGRGYKALIIIDPVSGEVHDAISTPLVISYR